MTSFTATRPAASATRRPTGYGNRFVAWLVALDAGYRNAHKLAHMSDDRLDDMGISRADAQEEFARKSGTVNLTSHLSRNLL